jgi:PAS domain S-box-containing protein
VIQRILEQSTDALRVEVVSLALIDPDTQELVFRATTDPNSRIIGQRLAIGKGVAGWVARKGRGAVVPDVRQDPRFYPEMDRLTGAHTRAIACAPIQAGGRVIGVLEALNPLAGAFDNDALLVLTGIGSLAGTAINHAQLFERLQTAHQRYYDLFEDSMDAILVTDANGAILEVNQQVEALLNLERAALRGQNIHSLKVADPEKLGRNFEALAGATTINYETMLATPAGRDIPVEVYARRVRIEGRAHLQWIIHDITARKNLETLRDDLISMIYHDLRSPLANVVSSLDVLENIIPLQDDPTLQSLLNIAVRSTERIQRLTNSLLDLRRLESGEQITNRQTTSVQALVDDASEALRHTLESKNLVLERTVPDQLPPLFVDSDMIRRVLINLLENAAKYSPEHSQLEVSAASEIGGLLLTVRDHGPGIPEGDRERIFDKFTRLHGSERARGFGLGLAFCRLAVEGHGGRIWVENAPDQGACFKFFLPQAGEG